MILARSLRARLLFLLLSSILLVAGIQSYVAYRTVLDETNAVFDYHMQQMVIALRPTLQNGNEASVAGKAAEDKTSGDQAAGDFLISIWKNDGVRVFESAGSADLPQLAAPGFANIKAKDKTYRILSVQVQSQTIQVAQDLAVRHRMARRMAWRTAAPILLLVPILILLAWWVVQRSLLPVARVRDQVAERQSIDLSSISEVGLPNEISPLVSEFNALLKRVGEAFDKQQQFVADAAHELRSPLAALKLQAEYLQRATSPDEREVANARLTAGIDRATHLVEQLLALARQDASANSEKPPQAVVLAEVARQALTESLAIAQDKGIDLGLDHSDAARVDGDPDALRVLTRNLIDNAVKYSPPGSRVDVEVHSAHGRVELSVDDSGPGIPPEQRARVFDRFYRIDGIEAAGSGLGLAIVKSIADRHRAELALMPSETLGGLRVVVRFALSSLASPPPSLPQDPPIPHA